MNKGQKTEEPKSYTEKKREPKDDEGNARISDTNDAEVVNRRAGRNKVSQKKIGGIQVAAFGLKNDLLLTRHVDKGWAKPITLISQTR